MTRGPWGSCSRLGGVRRVHLGEVANDNADDRTEPGTERGDSRSLTEAVGSGEEGCATEGDERDQGLATELENELLQLDLLSVL